MITNIKKKILCKTKKIEDKHKIYFDKLIKSRLTKYGGVLPVKIKNLLLKSLNEIRDGDSEVFARKTIPTFESEIGKYSTNTQIRIKNSMKRIFDYSSFSRKSGKWNAYRLCEIINVGACPYCQLIETTTTKRIRPTLDHFYDKDSYPYLGISLKNLIPCCSLCNTSLKGTKNFFNKTHANPYADKEEINFILELDALALKRGELAPSKPALKINTSSLPHERSIETFDLIERYKVHASTAIQIALDTIEIEDAIRNQNIPIHKIDRFRGMATRGITIKNYTDKTIGKLTLDIHKQVIVNL